MIKPIDSVLSTKSYVPPLGNRLKRIRLDFNESNFGPSPEIKKFINNNFENLFSQTSFSIYPEDFSLINSISQKFNIPQEQILLTNGSNEAIKLIMDTYLEKDDQVIIPYPTFSIYVLLSSLKQAKIKTISYNKDLAFPINSLLGTINEKTKMIFIVNPNNPTGTCIKKSDFELILKKAPSAAIILDEAYWHYSKTNFSDLLNKYDNLFILRTFSKAYSLAGLRIGFLLSTKENIQNIFKASLPYRINILSLKLAEIALQDEKYLNKTIEITLQERESLINNLKNINLEIPASETNFFLLNIGVFKENFISHLLERNILIRNMSSYELLKNYVRISIGVPQENKLLLEGIKEFYKKSVIIFDMDDTLIKVKNSYIKSIIQTVFYFSKQEINESLINSIRAMGGYNNDWDLTEKVLLDLKIRKDKQEIIRVFQEYYKENKKSEIWLFDEKILQKLSSKYKLAIFTGRTREEAEYALNLFGKRKYFEKLVCLEDTGINPKPSSFGVELILKALKVKYGVYIGDTVDDMNSAIRAKIIPVGIAKNEKKKSLLKENGAKYIFEDINEIVEIF